MRPSKRSVPPGATRNWRWKPRPSRKKFSAATATVFRKFPAERPNVDYLDYASENTAETLALFASQIKATAGHDAWVHAPYGPHVQPGNQLCGPCGLNELLNSDVDGLCVACRVRRLTSTRAGHPGAVHSALHHGKSWLSSMPLMNPTAAVYDDAAAKTCASGSTTRSRSRRPGISPAGASPSTRRNFNGPREHSQVPAMIVPSSRRSRSTGWIRSRPESRLMTVAGRNCRFHQVRHGDQQRFAPTPLTNVLRGRSMQICLLSDLLAGTVPATPCYLPEHVPYPAASRDVPHTMLRETGATAIRLYAPGYCNGGPTPLPTSPPPFKWR